MGTMAPFRGTNGLRDRKGYKWGAEVKGLSGEAAPELHASDVDVADTADGSLAARSMGLRTDHVELHHLPVEYRAVPLECPPWDAMRAVPCRTGYHTWHQLMSIEPLGAKAVWNA